MNRLRKFESQLVEGFWSPTATYVFAVIGVTATEAIAGVAIADTAYNAYQSNKVGNASLSLAQGTQGKQEPTLLAIQLPLSPREGSPTRPRETG